ncbi:Rho-type gtpase-activating protein [Rhizopus azygosporus]|uniref:Rho-type gtpase-activating protein n=1 Tax=Rhizopus azygosporus TaxID=86630 RepID=A0A367J6R1_RHIAZ|nr:Rho-type gtpase-activating protein [Rhizopus azygosporus]
MVTNNNQLGDKRRQKNLLSFLTSSKSNFFSNNNNNRKAMITKGIFGAPLKSASMCGSCNQYGLIVPDPVYRCFEEIMSRGLFTEGIFRLSGAAPDVEQLQYDFDRPPTYGKYLDLKDKDIHAITGVVKKYLRQLPDPPIPVSSHERFIQFFDESYSHNATIKAFAAMIQQLPREHFHLVHYIIILTSSIRKHSNINMMNPEALAIVLAPVCTGLELNLKEIPSWVKRHTKMEDMSHFIEMNTKWTRIWTLLIEYSDTLLDLWKNTIWQIPQSVGRNTLPCRPMHNKPVHQNSLPVFQEHETLLEITPFKPPARRANSTSNEEIYKVVVMRPRYNSRKSLPTITRSSLTLDDEEEEEEESNDSESFYSLFSRSSVSVSH